MLKTIFVCFLIIGILSTVKLNDEIEKKIKHDDKKTLKNQTGENFFQLNFFKNTDKAKEQSPKVVEKG
ncbi:hypothetical protein Mgra_00008530 [Meloidogyne graminicola]|uniref:Uncharacterized protein n=1 Tax=Meloidogyne graminicola TaxID=189291 RepID=A0A8S9ZFJ5_9BILA|nr:hypothetical protein Mgra_00008530 [Meloidogyne graminicola]